ncbi:hypothetical protein SDC9_147425 [bioreactor metagenome]|uniref:Uncharacterized protein n=1 Tax=bioreactor metagenome TaxID=1076179 RepID=A0A645EEB2_9ZZZZ
MYPGIVTVATALICSKTFTSQVAEDKLTVSEIGDNLSPKIAPEITAPAVIAGSMPRPPPIPIRATPKVAAVPHEVPVARHDIEHTKIVVSKKTDGDII